MTVLAIGVDPGVTTGVAIMNAKGFLDAWQDDKEPSTRRLVMWLRENRDAEYLIGVEDAYMGKGPHAALHVARSGGFVEGALFIAGIPTSRMVKIKNSEWHKEVGVTGKRREDHEASVRFIARTLTGRIYANNETDMATSICIAQAVWGRIARRHLSPIWRNSK